MGIGNFTDGVGNNDAMCGSLRIFAMFINSTPLLSKKGTTQAFWCFFHNLLYKRFINLRFYKINSPKLDFLYFQASINTSWVLFKCDFLMLEKKLA